MRLFLIISLSLLLGVRMSAHPGIGLVYDGHRYIYYTDLAHVWKLDTESGISEIAVKDVHSHELVLDQYGTLYGEHYWYDETEKTFKNYIWQLGSQGEFKIIRDTIKGENEDFGFVRDSVFGSYELEINQDQYSIVRSDSLSKKILQSAQLQNPGWLYLSANDELYFTDLGSVYKYYKGDLNNVASNLASSRFPFSLQANGHNLYGIWKDFDHNVYLADYSGRLVKKISQQGAVSKVRKTGFFWSPVNGVFDKDQRLWLMESSLLGKVRVSKVAISTLKSPFLLENIFIGLFSLFLIAGLYDLLKRILRSAN